QVGRVLAVLEPRSNTMKMGVHQQPLADALQGADSTYLFQPADLNWDLAAVAAACPNGKIFSELEALIAALVAKAQAGDHILIMSNGGFGGIHTRLLQQLELQHDH